MLVLLPAPRCRQLRVTRSLLLRTSDGGINSPTSLGIVQRLRGVQFASPAWRGDIGRIAEVCRGCGPNGEPPGCGEYKLSAGLIGALRAGRTDTRVRKDIKNASSAFGTFPRQAAAGK